MNRYLLFLFLCISTSMFAQPILTLDSIVVVKSNDTVYVWDYNAWEQCGFMLDCSVNVVDSIITVTQIDTAEDATTCYGYHNFVAPVAGLSDGNYRIDIYRDCLFEEIQFIKSHWFYYSINAANNYDRPIAEFQLYDAFPNPFNPITKISYSIPKYGFVSLFVYNSLGQLIKRLVSGNQIQGKHFIDFNAESLASGIYYYRLQFDNNIKTKKILLLK